MTEVRELNYSTFDDIHTMISMGTATNPPNPKMRSKLGASDVKGTIYLDTALAPRPKQFSLDRLKINLNRLRNFLTLHDNWDNQGARKISSVLIKSVENVVTELKYQPHVFPTGRGSIQIEFGSPGKDYLEVEISENGYEGFARAKQETWDLEGTSMKELVTSVNEFNSRGNI